MKKWIIFAVAIILLAAVLLTLTVNWLKTVFTEFFSLFVGVPLFPSDTRKETMKISHPQNVYEEIWNLLLIEEYSNKKTVLTSSTEGARERHGREGFQYIQIRECNTSISWYTINGEEELYFYLVLSPDGLMDAKYTYNRTTKTLYGETELYFLLENFLEDYFQWCEESEDFSSNYSMKAMGEFAFQYADPAQRNGQSG